MLLLVLSACTETSSLQFMERGDSKRDETRTKSRDDLKLQEKFSVAGPADRKCLETVRWVNVFLAE